MDESVDESHYIDIKDNYIYLDDDGIWKCKSSQGNEEYTIDLEYIYSVGFRKKPTNSEIEKLVEIISESECNMTALMSKIKACHDEGAVKTDYLYTCLKNLKNKQIGNRSKSYIDDWSSEKAMNAKLTEIAKRTNVMFIEPKNKEFYEKNGLWTATHSQKEADIKELLKYWTVGEMVNAINTLNDHGFELNFQNLDETLQAQIKNGNDALGYNLIQQEMMNSEIANDPPTDEQLQKAKEALRRLNEDTQQQN
jgi:hypothetical protein